MDNLKTDWLGFVVFIDCLVGITSFLGGIIAIFSSPWIGWGLIVGGVWLLLNFYYLVFGVEEIIKSEDT
jgi:hypothetical protein